MDAKLLLVKTITLLYLNGRLDKADTRVSAVASRVSEIVKPRDSFINTEMGESDPIAEMRDTLLSMAAHDVGFRFDEHELEQRFRVNARYDDGLYNALCSGLIKDQNLDIEDIKKRYSSQYNSVAAAVKEHELGALTKELNIKLNYGGHQDTKKLIEEYTKKAAELTNLQDEKSGPFDLPMIVSVTNMSIDEDLQAVFDEAQELFQSEGVIKTPFIGLNRMLGRVGGFWRGGTTVFTALTHHYKTGILLDIFMAVAMFNIPYMLKKDKKPLNLRISLENTRQQDWNTLFTRIYEYRHNKPAADSGFSRDESVQFVKDELAVNGYESMIVHINPTEFTYDHIVGLLDKLMAEGYEIHVLTLDYLNKMSKKGCEVSGATGDDVRELMSRMRNYCLEHAIAFITAHQFSSEARKLERLSPKTFIKEATARGYYDGCSRLEHELDLEIGLYIAKVNGLKYLCMQRGKDRLGALTPEEHKYCVYMFGEIGGLPIDCNGDDMSRKSVGADTEADGGKEAWFSAVGG